MAKKKSNWLIVGGSVAAVAVPIAVVTLTNPAGLGLDGGGINLARAATSSPVPGGQQATESVPAASPVSPNTARENAARQTAQTDSPLTAVTPVSAGSPQTPSSARGAFSADRSVASGSSPASPATPAPATPPSPATPDPPPSPRTPASPDTAD